MAPLYKRYVPPKNPPAASNAPATANTPPNVATASTKEQIQNGKAPSKQEELPTHPKRKRERSEAEVAERKAKKLRKKGIDPESVLLQESTVKPVNSNGSGTNDIPSELAVEETIKIHEPQGEFAHIKNAKKRHKLEKEARKVRKKVDKGGEDTSVGFADSSNATQEVGRSNVTKHETKKSKSREPDGKDASGQLLDTNEPVLAINSDATRVDRKEKKKKQRQLQDEGSTSIHAKTEEAVEATSKQDDASLSQPKKRRHKLESVLREPGPTTAATSDSDSHLRNHSKVMGKYEQSRHITANTPAALQPTPSEAEQDEQPSQILDLAPLPQPKPAEMAPFTPTLALLPWLANPTLIPTSAPPTSFSDLNLPEKTLKHLANLSFTTALPIQAALIPLLLPPGTPGSAYPPGTETVVPDLAVAAPTGSGKTLAYLVPICEALGAKRGKGGLRALVVVPTRELVLQVGAVAEAVGKGLGGLKVGMAVAGAKGGIVEEGNRLVKKERQLGGLVGTMDECEEGVGEDYELDFDLDSEKKRLEKEASYTSAIDILVATPGRLHDHLTSTPGFSLSYLEYLVLDEADQLLSSHSHRQSSSSAGGEGDFLSAINAAIAADPPGPPGARERYLRSKGSWKEVEKRERRVRKVVCSATLSGEGLVRVLERVGMKWARMLVVRSETGEGVEGDVKKVNEQDAAGVFELPRGLRESSVHVGDGTEKAVYLVKVLRDRILRIGSADGMDENLDAGYFNGDDSDRSSRHSIDEDDEISEDSSRSSADPKQAKERETNAEESNTMHPARAAMLASHTHHQQPPQLRPSAPPTILIFASSTETAQRLSHLLRALLPSHAQYISSLTSQSKKKAFSTAKPDDPIIVISTDRLARGLDALARPITHVIQYDAPKAVTGYVHRVGRTARAGRDGEAWTLLTQAEAGRFGKEVVHGRGMRRFREVERVRVRVDDEEGEELRDKLERAVGEIREVVFGRNGK